METNSKGFFWASYADLMTSLFIVMLVLFVLSFKLFSDREKELKKNNERLEVIEKEYNRLQNIKLALRNIEGKYFRYDPINKRHELIVDVEFRKASSVIQPRYYTPLISAGKTLLNVIENIEADKDVNYIVIIEGMAARYNDVSESWKNNDESIIDFAYRLSYNRALSLKQLWESQGIDFSDERFEIIVAGSGFYGTGRYEGQEEGKNKRFLIQVIPKIGDL